MRILLLVSGLLALGGCGFIGNMVEGPSIYGGICNDFEAIGKGTGPCGPGVLMALDVPFSFAFYTLLLPFTICYEIFASDEPAPNQK